MRRVKTIVSLGIIALVIGLLLGFSFQPGKPVVVVPSSGTMHLIVDFGDGGIKTWPGIPFVTGATAFSILKDARVPLVYDPSTGAGIFVRQIGDKKNGAGGGRYWQYWVNAKFAMVAADQYFLHPGDTVEWKFVAEQEM